MAVPIHDWYLKEWLKTLGKKQADLERDLDMNKAKVSLIANGKQPYDRDDVNLISAYLLLEPFELLLPPERAMAFRQMRSSAEAIVKEAPPPEPPTANAGNKFDKKAGASKEKRAAASWRGTGTHG